jgi:putative transposase
MGGAMRTSRFTEERILYAIQPAKAGVAVPELRRKYGVAQATFYGWREKYGAQTKSELARLKDFIRRQRRI